jgi:hypothetical protein
MANYNPHVPDIVGQEWVPIIGQPYQPDITEERGYSFTVSKTSGAAPIVVRRGLFTLANVPSGVTTSQVPFMSLYPKGEERCGPVQSVVMECDDAVSSGSDGAFFGALTGGQALRNPSDGSGYDFTSGSAPISGVLDLSFNISDLPSFVGRVYNVSLLYSADGDGLEQATIPNSMLVSLRYRSTDFFYSTGALQTGASFRGDLNKLASISLGEINPNWSNATFTGTNDRYPWTLPRLQLFSAASGDPMRIRFQWQAPELNTELKLYYAALQITYSPFENRIMYGGTHMGIDQVQTGTSPNYGFNGDDVRNRVMLRTANTLVTGSGLELQPGEYTVTFNLADYGDANQPLFNINAAAATNTRPTLDAIRELYEVPSINGVEIERAFTTSDVIRVAESRIIPSIGITVTGTAGPGAGDVYSGCQGYFTPKPGDAVSIATPSQNFHSDNKDGALPYPWIRFYARQTSGPIHADAGLTLAVTTPSGGSVFITSAQLDALPEIFDGWREVTLRFADGTAPLWDGDAATSRVISWNVNGIALDVGVAFQVLGAQTGLSFNNAAYQGSFSAATGGFFPLSSSSIGDYTFLFSTDPPTITGIGVSTASVALTGIGTECSTTPACIPTSMNYNRVTWPVPHSATAITDDFTRAVSSGWGTSTSGQAWTTTGGSAADYSVTVADGGIHNVTSTGVARTSLIGATTIRDFDVTAVVRIMGAPATQPNSASVVGRWVDSSNFYEFRLEWSPTATPRNGLITIRRTLTGSDSILVSTIISPMVIAAGDRLHIRASAQGSTLRMKVWNQDDGEREPELWQAVVSDTSFTQGQVGLRSMVNALSTATLPIQFRWDAFNALPSSWNFGYYELQRTDDDTPWQTIMKATSPEVSGFSDFEARISMRSDYRIRQVNVYEFPGLWSPIVSNTLPSPITGTGADGHELLVFTTNTNQTHGQTLAYEEVWDGNPSQEQTYFEGEGMMQFQRMYRRDYQVGFHALERGGVRFERVLLVQNAAVPPPIVENAFQSLRDMAWESLPYVCVLTNQGDRWYAAVEVPSGTISRTRRLQLVQVKITEVGDEPYPVDPPGVTRAV